jgi:hypothetical protein
MSIYIVCTILQRSPNSLLVYDVCATKSKKGKQRRTILGDIKLVLKYTIVISHATLDGKREIKELVLITYLGLEKILIGSTIDELP